VRVVAGRVNQSFCISLCTTLEMLKKFRARVFYQEKGAISDAFGYCALFKK